VIDDAVANVDTLRARVHAVGHGEQFLSGEAIHEERLPLAHLTKNHDAVDQAPL
jgi:hypothetical protein